MWDLREPPTVQALIRVLLGVVLLSDLLTILRFDLVVPMFAPESIGGFSDAMARNVPPLLYRMVEPTQTTAWLHFGGMLLAASTLTVGLATRTSSLVLLLLSAQHAQILPPADRGIDMLVRNVLLLLVFAGAGRTWSVDSRIRTGSWKDDSPIPAWPRHLLILQLVVMYFTAGIQKAGILWLPMGRFDALYVLLQDPAVARTDWSWLVHEPFLTLTRIGTATTLIWEWSAPVVLLIYAWRLTGAPHSRLGRLAIRTRAHLIWLSVGVVFHLGIAATLELGIFPWAMLALYPAFLHPDDLARVTAWARSRLPARRAERPLGRPGPG